MRYICLIYDDESQFATMSEADGAKVDAGVHAVHGRHREERPPPRRGSAPAEHHRHHHPDARTARWSRPTGRSPRPRSSSAATTSSRPRTSTRPRRSRRASRPSRYGGAIEVRPIMEIPRTRRASAVAPGADTLARRAAMDDRRLLRPRVRADPGDADPPGAATSISPRRRCRTPSRRRSSSGRRRARPHNPRAWIVSTARHKAIDRLCARQRAPRQAARAQIESRPAPASSRAPRTARSPTTACASSSPAAIRRSPSRRRWR